MEGQLVGRGSASRLGGQIELQQRRSQLRLVESPPVARGRLRALVTIPRWPASGRRHAEPPDARLRLASGAALERHWLAGAHRVQLVAVSADGGVAPVGAPRWRQPLEFD